MGTIPDDRSWRTPAAWGTVTLVLTVIVFTLDPLWAYFGAWAAGFMTAFSAIKTKISKYERARLEAEDEELLLEVQEARKEDELGDKAPDRPLPGSGPGHEEL